MIANLNLNSLLKHIDKICTLLCDNPFDILAINESKIVYSIPDSEIHVNKLNNYPIVRLGRNRFGGGVSVRTDFVLGNLEIICVQITNKHSKIRHF